mmetsp:Transcript_30849/g.88084  ORF Transcript_30849/g.88084 Transcript_30849/m.88084 type:complete len:205 (-) Transcript_30849:458-1072(-)
MSSRLVPGGRRSVSVIFQPSMKRMVSTCWPQKCASGSEQPTGDPACCRAFSASLAFCASRRKSTSSNDARRISLTVSVISGASSWSLISILTRNSMLSKSISASSATPGCPIFTHTFSPPLRSRATWAWPILAEAMGLGSNSPKMSSRLAPRSWRTMRRTIWYGVVGMWSCSGVSACTQGSGSVPAMVEAFWPTLMKKPRCFMM